MVRLSSRTYVPAADTADNSTTRDVVGNKTDTSAGNSLYAHSEVLLDHVHSASEVFPTLANGIAVTGGASWVLGVFSADLIGAGVVTDPFDIHHISVENLDTNAVYELVIYYGAGDTEAGRVRFTKNAVQDGTVNAPFQCVIIPGGSRVRAKIADSAGSSIATIALMVHRY